MEAYRGKLCYDKAMAPLKIHTGPDMSQDTHMIAYLKTIKHWRSG